MGKVSEFAVGILMGVTKYESVLAQALELSEEERELLAIQVGLSLNESPAGGYETRWEAEIKRRIEAVDRGEEEEMDWEEVREELMGGQ